MTKMGLPPEIDYNAQKGLRWGLKLAAIKIDQK